MKNGKPPLTTADDLRALLPEANMRFYSRAERVPLGQVTGWDTDPSRSEISHHTGRFFKVVGVEVSVPEAPVACWSQPIIDQPETGILALLVQRFDDALRALVQLKPEPGNVNGVQLSPTVQATRSNFTGAHGGAAVPYVDHVTKGRGRMVVDVLQSEHGAWFLHKRNRNMILEISEPVEVPDGFVWLPLAELYRLLLEHDLVNADTRTVLSSMPCPGPMPSADEMVPVVHHLTDLRSRTEMRIERRPVNTLPGWRRDVDAIRHESGAFFEVIGIRVEASGREVGSWSQPIFAPQGTGLLALFCSEDVGERRLLMHLRIEPGLRDTVELAPTVQCDPANYDYLPDAARPRFLDEATTARGSDILFDSVLSDEGGRFYRSRARHLIIRVPHFDPPPGFVWVTESQLGALLQHSDYVNMQARSIWVCLRSIADLPVDSERVSE